MRPVDEAGASMTTVVLADGLVRDDEAARAVAFRYDGPARMTAGAYARWTMHFVARTTLAAGARIAVAHRWPSDWGVPQSADPAGADSLDAVASTVAPVRWWSARMHTWHPFDHVVFVELPHGLPAGETIALRYGDARNGSPGFRSQTFIEEASPFSLRWQTCEGGPWVEFARHAVEIVGAAPERLVANATSRVAAGTPFELHVRIEDRWGNPATLDAPIDIDVLDDDVVVASASMPARAWLRLRVQLATPGVRRLAIRARGQPALHANSNPIDVSARAPAAPLHWGDLHAQSIIGCGARSIDAFYAHARDFSGSDFASHQANCFLVSNAEWRDTVGSARRHHESGRFVTLLGVEWSAASPLGGDHNLYFPGDDAQLRRCSHEFLADRSDVDTDLPHVEDLHRHYRGSDTLVAVHVGGRTADLTWHEPGLERLLEVHSTHATSEWFLFDALRRGYRMGVIAGSDGVDGRPGNSHPGHLHVRNVRNGLTAILAPSLTREALWQALRARHCYATTGERILVSWRCGDATMGDAINVRDPVFALSVEGTAPLERIDFFRGTQRLARIDCFAHAGPPSNRVRVGWRGLSAPGNFQRARMQWDGELRIEGGRILDVEGWAFDTPDEGVRERDEARVRWRSLTAGDWDGVILTLDRPDDVSLTFVTGPMTLRQPPLRDGRARFDASDPERSVEFVRLPARMPSMSYAGDFRDPSPIAGEQPYWVRVRQSDGAIAWTSPIFVTCGER